MTQTEAMSNDDWFLMTRYGAVFDAAFAAATEAMRKAYVAEYPAAFMHFAAFDAAFENYAAKDWAACYDAALDATQQWPEIEAEWNNTNKEDNNA